MTKLLPMARLASFRLTSDGAFGALGGGLALGALSFGVYMNVHGPSASLGTSKDFTVFAQLGPHTRAAASGPSTDDADLDTTATATIPAHNEAASGEAKTIIPSISLAAADDDEATLMMDGRARRVHVGDDVPGAGEVLAILPGTNPIVRTSRGLIVPSRKP